MNADEVFATSTAGGIMPITKLNGRDIGSGSMGPMTRQIHDAYWAKHLDDYWSADVQCVLDGVQVKARSLILV